MIKIIFCPYCNERHIDKDEETEVIINGVKQGRFKNFGREPHLNHTCLSCGVTFPDLDGEESIGV